MTDPAGRRHSHGEHMCSIAAKESVTLHSLVPYEGQSR